MDSRDDVDAVLRSARYTRTTAQSVSQSLAGLDDLLGRLTRRSTFPESARASSSQAASASASSVATHGALSQLAVPASPPQYSAETTSPSTRRSMPLQELCLAQQSLSSSISSLSSRLNQQPIVDTIDRMLVSSPLGRYTQFTSPSSNRGDATSRQHQLQSVAAEPVCQQLNFGSSSAIATLSQQPLGRGALSSISESLVKAKTAPPAPEVELVPASLLAQVGGRITVHYFVIPPAGGGSSDSSSGDSSSDSEGERVNRYGNSVTPLSSRVFRGRGQTATAARRRPAPTAQDYIEVFPSLDQIPSIDSEEYRKAFIEQPPFDREVTHGARHGSVSLTMPLVPGRYIVRYVHGSFGDVAGRSPPFVVEGLPAPSASSSLASLAGGPVVGSALPSARSAASLSFALTAASGAVVGAAGVDTGDQEEDNSMPAAARTADAWLASQVSSSEPAPRAVMSPPRRSPPPPPPQQQPLRLPEVEVGSPSLAPGSDVSEPQEEKHTTAATAADVSGAAADDVSGGDHSSFSSAVNDLIAEVTAALASTEAMLGTHEAEEKREESEASPEVEGRKEGASAVSSQLQHPSPLASGGVALEPAPSDGPAEIATAGGDSSSAEVQCAPAELHSGSAADVVVAHSGEAESPPPQPPAAPTGEPSSALSSYLAGVLSAPVSALLPASPLRQAPTAAVMAEEDAAASDSLPAPPPLPSIEDLSGMTSVANSESTTNGTSSGPAPAAETISAAGDVSVLEEKPSEAKAADSGTTVGGIVERATIASISQSSSAPAAGKQGSSKKQKSASSSSNSVMSASSSAVAARPAVRPPFLLEKHVRISVYQLYIPTPQHFVLPAPLNEIPRHLVTGTGVVPASALGGGLMGPATSVSDVNVTGAEMVPVMLPLPNGWRPGVAFDDESDGVLPAVEVAYELPRIPQAALAELVSQGVGSLPLPLRDQGKLVSRSPRDLHALRLQLDHRVDSAEAALRLYHDHVSVRLPMFYAGSALPDRPSSLITAAEVAALRSHGCDLACRKCGATFIVGQASATTAADVTGQQETSVQQPDGEVPTDATEKAESNSEAETGAAQPPVSSKLRALVLPSEYWLEWSDFWLCHEEERNILIPDTDFGAIRGAILIGETALQLHPGDVQSDALFLRASSLHRPSLLELLPVPGVAPSLTPVQCSLHCASCQAMLGTTLAPVDEQSPGRFDLPSAPAPGGWRDRLSIDADPVIRLHKDAVALARVGAPSASPSATAASTGSVGVTSPLLPQGGVFASYTVCTRLAQELYSSAHTHQQYRYVIFASDGAQPAAAPGEDAEEDAYLFSQARLQLVILNWNTSIRGATSPLQLPNAAPSTTGAATTGEHFDRDRDVPVLKIRYSAADGASGGGEAARAWASAGATQHVFLPSADIEGVTSMLRYTTTLLPQSVRQLEGMSIGYLPFA